MKPKTPNANKAQAEVAQRIPVGYAVAARVKETVKSQEDDGEVGERVDELGNVTSMRIVGLAPIDSARMWSPV